MHFDLPIPGSIIAVKYIHVASTCADEYLRILQTLQNILECYD